MARGGFPRNMGGMGNMNSMIKQAQKMQEEMLKAQESLGEQVIETSVGGGAVSVKVNGKKEVMEIWVLLGKERMINARDSTCRNCMGKCS